MFYLTIVIVILTIQSSIIIADNPCEFYTGQGLINLTTVAKNDGTAAYPDQSTAVGSNFKYSYNPCRPFTEGSGCLNVAACQITSSGGYTYSLGTHDSATWNDGSSSGLDPSITYSYNARITHVTLECAPTPPYFFEAIGEIAQNTFRFRLRHKCACWDGCKYAPDTTTTTRTTETTETTSHKPSTTKESTTTASRSSTAQTTPSVTTNAARHNCNIISRGTVLIVILLVFIFVH